MFKFKQFILEDLALILEAKTKGVKAGNAADSRGKLAEGLVAQHMLGGEGNHPEDYRIEGKKPADVHQVHGTFLYGENFRKHPEYKQISNAIGRAVNELKTHIKKKYGINKIARVAATSQTSEHESETGLKDPHFKGDVVATGAYSGRDHKKGKKVAVSIKFYTGKNKPTNWANHGMKSMQDYSGADFSKHREEHERTLSKFKIPKNERERKDWYKALPEKKRNQLDDSYRRMVIGVAGSYATGLKKKHHSDHQPTQDENLKSFIKKNVGATGQVDGGNVLEGKTHLPHAMLKLKQKPNGEFTHKVTDIPTHVHNYLSHFRNLRVEHGEGDLGNTSSVAITGEHKTTGERMTLHRTAIYGGSTGHATKSGFRTQTTLPSEDHKSVNTDTVMLKEEINILSAAAKAHEVFESLVAEEAPANSMGTAGISGLESAQDGIMGYDKLLMPGVTRRRPPKMFAGKAVFTVPSSDFYNATLGRKKGKHYRSYVRGELGEQVRQFALENKNAPIILEDETTGAMMYLKYGKGQ